ncbi:McbB family protein [Pseudomonas izuensis]|uniref:McbB family protein n=1 Tax=Pseudomonas izuensis TaxID=2684212 RepID=A0ABM7RZK2_9PSED|nr:McbB family protein [Pseudomonas izuensis]BCX67472.1 McbB family protein [Pseudomonas izuensis]
MNKAFLVLTRKALEGNSMKLNIQSYEILNFTSENLLVSKRGVSKINSLSLLAALSKLQSYRSISKAELSDMLSEHGLNPDAAYEFLEKTISIKEATDDLYFEKAVVAHDWGEDSDLERLLKCEITTPLEVCESLDSLSDSVLGKNFYIVILCKNYDYDRIKEIYFNLADVAPGSAISIGYRTGSSYCISQPYLPRVGSPCHFCNIDRLMNYEGYKASKNSWSKLLRFCKSKHIAVPVNPLNVLQRSLVVGALIKKIKLLTSPDAERRYQDNILQETHVDFNGAFVRDVSTSHWYMCDCLRLEK